MADNFQQDRTTYARSLGYSDTRPVLVRDGKVVSHGNVDWFVFTGRLRQKRI